jgi:hypothetical protein
LCLSGVWRGIVWFDWGLCPELCDLTEGLTPNCVIWLRAWSRICVIWLRAWLEKCCYAIVFNRRVAEGMYDLCQDNISLKCPLLRLKGERRSKNKQNKLAMLMFIFLKRNWIEMTESDNIANNWSMWNADLVLIAV